MSGVRPRVRRHEGGRAHGHALDALPGRQGPQEVQLPGALLLLGGSLLRRLLRSGFCGVVLAVPATSAIATETAATAAAARAVAGAVALRAIPIPISGAVVPAAAAARGEEADAFLRQPPTASTASSSSTAAALALASPAAAAGTGTSAPVQGPIGADFNGIVRIVVRVHGAARPRLRKRASHVGQARAPPAAAALPAAPAVSTAAALALGA